MERPKIGVRWFLLHVFPFVPALLIGSWMVRDTPPTKVFVFDAVKRSVLPGETQTLEFDGYRYRACPVSSDEELIDASGRHFQMPARLANPARRSGKFNTPIEVVIPHDAARGWATYRSIATYGIDWTKLCFTTYVIGPPERPEARFWIGDNPPWTAVLKR
jgi:hypothetical protein